MTNNGACRIRTLSVSKQDSHHTYTSSIQQPNVRKKRLWYSQMWGHMVT
jgi:hypothetical protein